MLSQTQQDFLKSRARARDPEQGVTLDQAIAQIRSESPEKFHTDASLKERVFFNQPTLNLPCKAFVVPRPREV